MESLEALKEKVENSPKKSVRMGSLTRWKARPSNHRALQKLGLMRYHSQFVIELSEDDLHQMSEFCEKILEMLQNAQDWEECLALEGMQLNNPFVSHRFLTPCPIRLTWYLVIVIFYLFLNSALIMGHFLWDTLYNRNLSISNWNRWIYKSLTQNFI